MSTNGRTTKQSGKGHRPRAATVFAAAFIAGAAAAFGVNRALDVHLAQSKPRVESEPIFVALRSLPQGAAVTVWDVALRDWPKAMMPAAAMRPQDSFDGAVLKHPIREGQPLLTFQLVKAPTETDSQMAGAVPAALPSPQPVDAIPQPDLWAPGEQPAAPATAAAAPVATPVAAPVAPPIELAAEAVIPPTTGEPTVAVAPPVEPATTAVEPEVVSVVQPAPTTDIEPPPAVPPQTQAVAATPAVRYLVVPERIAMQADRSFVAPAPTQPQAMQPVQQPQSVDQVKPQPQQVSKQPPPVREAPQSNQQRTRTARQPRSTATQQQPSQQRPAANSQRQPTSKPRGNTSAFQSMFPNLSAGMTAVEEQLQKIKRDREAAADAADQQPQQPARSARSF